MPTVALPAMRSIRMLSAFSARQRSSREIGDAAVLDSSFRLEFERGNNRTGIDLRDLAVHVKLGVFFGQHLRQKLEFVGIDRLLLIRTLQQTARRQLVATRDPRHRRLGLVIAVGALGDFRIARVAAPSAEARGKDSARIPPVVASRWSAGSGFGIIMSLNAGAARLPQLWLHGVGASDVGRDGISCVFTIGLEMRRLSSSFC
jgi:hypothetical protein